jgi:sulfite exporter TauE/SafE
MTSVFIGGLLLGALGSVHCIGMCGPIALALPSVNSHPAAKFTGTLLYNAGRIFTYSILGAVFGLVGMSFGIFGLQQWLSVILGLTIIIFLVVPMDRLGRNNVLVQFFSQLRSSLAALFSRRNYQSLFAIGLLNGLLPCGMIYMAVAAAISTAAVLKSSLFMAAFGLGTLPVMWSISFFGSAINLQVRKGIKKMYPYILFGMAALLIIRGLGLQIPYLSPGFHHHMESGTNVLECHD